MRVVEEGAKTQLLLEREDLVRDFRLAPFVDDDNVGAAKVLLREFREGGVIVVEVNIEPRIYTPELVDRADGALALILHEVGQRPGAQLLVTFHLVADLAKRAGEAAQKMRVAVVPVGNPRMSEIMNVQLLTHATATPAGTTDSYKLM